jgi:hypothetical protein
MFYINRLFEINLPHRVFKIFKNFITLKVLSLTDSQLQVGNIKKEYAGFVREMYTTADNFSLSCKIA